MYCLICICKQCALHELSGTGGSTPLLVCLCILFEKLSSEYCLLLVASRYYLKLLHIVIFKMHFKTVLRKYVQDASKNYRAQHWYLV